MGRMLGIVASCVVLLLAYEHVTSESTVGQSPWTWVCKNTTCVKRDKADLDPFEEGNSVGVCKLNCDQYGSLWPKPTGKVELSKEFVPFYPQNVRFAPFQAPTPEVIELLQKSSKVFDTYMQQLHPDYFTKKAGNFPENDEKDAVSQNIVDIVVAVVFPENKLTLDTDEGYVLSIIYLEDKKTISVNIQSNTYFGARHALETLSQLIAYDDDLNALQIVERATISDRPVFSYRGILIDTSRNFISIEKLRRLVDGMSYNKLNMLHWHITDTHSFPMFSKTQPKMTKYGAYSPRQIYSIEDMQGLVEYGQVRGVKIVPEFDAPAHTGAGWQWGPSEGKGNMAVCIDKEPWASYCVEPPCGQLNPVNENMYKVLGDIYGDMLDIFDNDVFHMGGDEINFNCWNSSRDITEWLTKNGKDRSMDTLLDLWDMFQRRARGLLTERSSNKNMTTILWTSELTAIDHIKKYLNNSEYVIQIWTTGSDPLIPYMIRNGYRVIFSNYDAWYFDCGYGAWVGSGPNNWCSPYKGWQQVYGNSPYRILANATSHSEAERAIKEGMILGGEAAMWTEQVGGEALEGKIWPRASALAERLWSNPKSGWLAAETRMVHNRQRYIERGLHADGVQPEWCRQNEKHCFL